MGYSWSPMKVCLYLELGDLLSRSGIYSAFWNHLRALRAVGARVTTDPGDHHDILHLHFFGPRSWRLLSRAKRRGIPVVVSAHSIGRYDFSGGFTGTSLLAPAYERFLHRFYRRADLILAPSEFAARELRGRGLGPVEVVSNGVDTERFRYLPERRAFWRRRLGLSRFSVYSAGNILPRKGILDFIAVARQLPEMDFIWFGQRWGPLAFYPRMEWEIRRAPSNVRFPGFVRESEGAYAACDLFFFPTQGENQPLVVLEAAALGRPLVLRDVPAFSGLEHGIHCLKGRSVEEFAEAIRAVADDPGLWERLSRGAREFARAHSLEAVGRRLLAVYRGLLER